jgi:hypothetical protein
MCTSRPSKRGTDMHQQAKQKRDRCAPASTGEEGQMCTSKHRRRGTDVHSRPSIRGTDVPQQQRRRGTDMHQQANEKKDRYAPAC